MEISQGLKETLNETRASLSGYQRRHFMAQIVEHMFDGNQTQAETVLGWNRKTLRKALCELRGGFCSIDHYHLRGRKPAEAHLPDLLDDMRAIVDGQSQTDPTFRTPRLYTRLSAAKVRRQLVEQKGYSDDELPCSATISRKLNEMGYRLQSVQKSRPQKNG